MNSESNNNTSQGIGFVGALTIAFIVLKLTGVIDWSWWWVLSPIWVGILLALALCVFFFLFLMPRE